MILLLTNALDSYGIFRDEYYFLACSRHLALGYVDQPPLFPVIDFAARPVYHHFMMGVLVPCFMAGRCARHGKG